MYRWSVALSIILVLISFSVAYGIKTGEVEIGQNGIYDGVVKIGRDTQGNLLFQDSEVTSPVLLKDLGHGVEDHGNLQGLSGDDHLQYLTDERHGQAHVASFNDALVLSPDVGNNTTLGSHVQDSDIHLQRGEAEQISGNWVFSGAPEFYAPVHFSNNGGTGNQALEFEAGEEDALIAWNATADGFELNKSISGPVGEFAIGKSTEMQVMESLSGRDVTGEPVAVIEGFSQIEGIEAQHLVDKTADEDINGQWDFLKNLRVTQTLSSLSSYLWALTAELTTTSNDTQNHSGLNRMGLTASSQFSNLGSGDVTHSWNIGVQGEARSTGKTTAGESINNVGAAGKASSESALSNVIGVAGFGDLANANRARIGVFGGLDSSIMGDPESLPTGEWAGYFAGNVHVTGTVSGDGIQKGLLVTVAKSGGDFSTIQAAIDSITDSGPTTPYVILVYPGIYEEQITLSKSYISIIGIQPNGAKITEAQNSGAIIKYQSSGSGDDLMTMWIRSGGATDLKGITIANLTIINTQSQGVGAAQEALDVGRLDTYPRAHEILISNCSLYGEQDTVFVNTGNPIFQNCYIEGDFDVCSLADDAVFMNCYVHSHTNGKLIWAGKSGDAAFTGSFINCTFDKAQSGSWYIGIFAHHFPTINLYNCTLLPNAANGANWDWNSKSATLNVFGTNGTDWGTSATFINYQHLKAKGDGVFEGGLNVGTATGAGTGEIKLSSNLRMATNTYIYGGTAAIFGLSSSRSELYGSGTEDAIKFYGKSPYPLRATIDANGLTMNSLDITASGQKVTAKVYDVENYGGGKPTASSTYRGQIVLEEGGSGTEDKLYICLKNADGSYGWVEVAAGVP